MKSNLFIVACYRDHEIEENGYEIHDNLKSAMKDFKKCCKSKEFKYVFLAPVQIGKGFNCIDAIEEWSQ
jgi:hypothetical protein